MYVFVCVFVGDGILNYTVWVGKRVFFIIQRFLTLVFSVWGGQAESACVSVPALTSSDGHTVGLQAGIAQTDATGAALLPSQRRLSDTTQ